MIKVKKSVRIAELESLIVKARNDYYNSQPTVTDSVYDAWTDELKSLKPDSAAITSIGAPPVSEWKKVTHSITMGSLDKINTQEELAAWRKVAPNQTLLVTEKLDGMSVHLQYDKGNLVLGSTRGDGVRGEDITVNVVKMQGVQKTLKEDFTGSVRGEIVLTNTDHQKYFSEYSSPRNAASGIAKRLDGVGVEHLIVMCYKVVDGKDFATEGMQFKWLEKMGFKTPNWSISNDPQKVWDEYQDGKRDQLDYDIDGLVLTINDTETQLELGEKDGRPQGSIAYKFAAITRESVLRDVIWQVGASGRITPVGIFDEVDILGSKITQASLYNAKYVDNLRLFKGCRILVARAGDVIPKILQNLDINKE
jgi:DNA ligase (NAD+)